MSSTANYASALIFMLTQESQANADTIVYVSTFIFDDIWDLFYFSFRHFSQETSYEIGDGIGEKALRGYNCFWIDQLGYVIQNWSFKLDLPLFLCLKN